MGKLSKKNRKNKDKPEEAKVVDDVPQEDAPTEPEKPKVTPMEVEETEKKPDSESDDEEVKEEPGMYTNYKYIVFASQADCLYSYSEEDLRQGR